MFCGTAAWGARAEAVGLEHAEDIAAGGGEAVVGAAEGGDGGDLGVLDAQEADQFAFEVLEGTHGRWVRVEIAEGAAEEIVEFGDGVLWLGDDLDQLDEIGPHGDAAIVLAQAIVWFAEFTLAQGVEVAFAAAGDGDLALEKEVDATGESALGLPGALGERLEFAVVRRQPGEDEAGFGKLGLPEEQGRGRIHRCSAA